MVEFVALSPVLQGLDPFNDTGVPVAFGVTESLDGVLFTKSVSGLVNAASCDVSNPGSERNRGGDDGCGGCSSVV